MNVDFNVILTSAVVSAIISSLALIASAWLNNRSIERRQELDIAIELTKIKDKQVELAINHSKEPYHAELHDPAKLTLSYLESIRIIKRRGRPEKRFAILKSLNLE